MLLKDRAECSAGESPWSRGFVERTEVAEEGVACSSMTGDVKLRPDVWTAGRGGNWVTMDATLASFFADFAVVPPDMVDAGGSGISPVTRLSLGLVQDLSSMAS